MFDFAVVRNLTIAFLLYGANLYVSGRTEAQAQMQDTASASISVASNSTVFLRR